MLQRTAVLEPPPRLSPAALRLSLPLAASCLLLMLLLLLLLTTTTTTSSTITITAMTLEDVDKSFSYLDRYGVLICKEHNTSVLNLSVHLRSFHKVTGKQRNAILQHFQGQPITPAQDIVLPAAFSPPIEELALPLDGLACKQDMCSYITVNIDTLRRHAKKQHGIAWKGNTAALYTEVKVQTFFKLGGLQRYFIVDTG